MILLAPIICFLFITFVQALPALESPNIPGLHGSVGLRKRYDPPDEIGAIENRLSSSEMILKEAEGDGTNELILQLMQLDVLLYLGQWFRALERHKVELLPKYDDGQKFAVPQLLFHERRESFKRIFRLYTRVRKFEWIANWFNVSNFRRPFLGGVGEYIITRFALGFLWYEAFETSHIPLLEPSSPQWDPIRGKDLQVEAYTDFVDTIQVWLNMMSPKEMEDITALSLQGLWVEATNQRNSLIGSPILDRYDPTYKKMSGYDDHIYDPPEANTIGI